MYISCEKKKYMLSMIYIQFLLHVMLWYKHFTAYRNNIYTQCKPDFMTISKIPLSCGSGVHGQFIFFWVSRIIPSLVYWGLISKYVWNPLILDTCLVWLVCIVMYHIKAWKNYASNISVLYIYWRLGPD